LSQIDGPILTDIETEKNVIETFENVSETYEVPDIGSTSTKPEYCRKKGFKFYFFYIIVRLLIIIQYNFFKVIKREVVLSAR
jgi:hypothetical protein